MYSYILYMQHVPKERPTEHLLHIGLQSINNKNIFARYFVTRDSLQCGTSYADYKSIANIHIRSYNTCLIGAPGKL